MPTEAEAIARFKEEAAADILSGAWIVTTVHRHCDVCVAQIDRAISHAKVTGSRGCTYHVTDSPAYGHEGPLNEHGATVRYETHDERRKALGLA